MKATGQGTTRRDTALRALRFVGPRGGCPCIIHSVRLAEHPGLAGVAPEFLPGPDPYPQAPCARPT